jgi:hypothetical protein
MSKPNQHLVFGPQGEQLIVTKAEARNWEAKNVERRSVKPVTEADDEQEVCPTCGRPKLAAEEEDDEV